MDSLNGTYKPPDNVGAEQNFLSEFFGLREQIQQLDLSYNFQIHQLGLVGETDAEEGRWSTLASRFTEINVLHYSAIPKPVHVMIGEITERTAGHMFDALVATDWLVLLSNQHTRFSDA